MKSTSINKKLQSGNALMFVLLGIVLFAALSYTIVRSGRTTQNVSIGDTHIHAQNIIAFAEKIDNALQRIMLQNNCRASKISFENPIVSGYTNTQSPANKKCHIFDSNGGGISYESPRSNVLDLAKSADALFGEYLFTGNVCVDNIGSGGFATCLSDGIANEELLLILPWVNYETCIALNQILKNPVMMEDGGDSFNGLKYTGTYAEGYALGDTGFTTYRNGCFKSTGTTPDEGYHFYYTFLSM